MKINLKLANGATLEFEGDPEEFDRISAFLAEPPDAMTAAPPTQGSLPAVRSEGVASTNASSLEPQADDRPDAPLNPDNVAIVLDSVGARSDLERVTVMAYLAKKQTGEGIDYPTVDSLYTDLGLRKPPRFPKAFNNAKTAGLVKNAGYGRWLPTVKGENFARGFGRVGAGGSTVRRARPQLAIEGEGAGESD